MARRAPPEGSTPAGEETTLASVTITSPRVRILQAQAVWMVAALALLTGIGMLRLELYFAVSFIGLLIVSQLFAPLGSNPRWWIRLRRLIAVGFVVLAYVIGLQAFSFL